MFLYSALYPSSNQSASQRPSNKEEHYETVAKKFKASVSVVDEESDDDLSDVDEALPSGACGPTSSYLKSNDIKGADSVSMQQAAPSVVLETKKDATSAHLQYFCLSNPITVVRNIGKKILAHFKPYILF